MSLTIPTQSELTSPSSASTEHTRSYVEAIIAVILLTVVILSVATILICTYTEGKYCFGEQAEPQVHPNTMGPDSSALVLKKPGVTAHNEPAPAPAGKVKTGAGKASMLVKSVAAVKSGSSKTAKSKTDSSSSKSRNAKSSSGRGK